MDHECNVCGKGSFAVVSGLRLHQHIVHEEDIKPAQELVSNDVLPLETPGEFSQVNNAVFEDKPQCLLEYTSPVDLECSEMNNAVLDDKPQCLLESTSS